MANTGGYLLLQDNEGSGAWLQSLSLLGLLRCPCSPGWSSVRVSDPFWGLGTWRMEF